MDPGRGTHLSPKRNTSRKRLTSPFRKLQISTSPRARLMSEESTSSLEEPGTPYASDRYTHTTYTTYCQGTAYTRYSIHKKKQRRVDLDERNEIMSTTFKTLKLNSKNIPTWYTSVTVIKIFFCLFFEYYYYLTSFFTDISSLHRIFFFLFFFFYWFGCKKEVLV